MVMVLDGGTDDDDDDSAVSVPIFAKCAAAGKRRMYYGY